MFQYFNFTARKTIVLLATILIISFGQIIVGIGITYADTNCSPNGIVTSGAGSNWLNGTGVNVCNNGSSSTDDYGANCVSVSGAPGDSHCSIGNVYSGEKWQCVEMVNRLYLTKGWTSSTWYGNGNTLINNIPAGLAKQNNSSISYLNPGDVITLDDGGFGHGAIINAVGSSIDIVSQNAQLHSSAYVASGSFSSGNAFLHMNGWAGYSIQAIVHHPTNSFEGAFQGNNSDLFVDNSLTGAADTHLGMMAGTSPAIVALPSGGYETAFQANNGDLFIYGAASTGDTGLGMKSGTSPSIAVSSSGIYQIDFQGNNGNLFIDNSSSGAANTGLGMKIGTSPAITALPSGGYESAFQANSGNMFIYGSASNGDTGLGMMAGTSPGIGVLPSGIYQMDFQANSGNLFIDNSSSGAANTGLGMKSGTSPSIVGLPSGGYESAFQANNGDLFIYGSASNGDTALGMKAGTSPAIAVSSSGIYQMDFQANNTDLFIDNSSTGAADTLLGMMAATSPGVGSGQ